MNFLIKFTLLVKFVIVDSISITKWELCKILSNGTDNTSFDLMDCRKIRRLGTVLSKLIEWNNTYSQTCRDDIYYGSNLQNIPDIAVYGNSFYTYAYKTRIELSELWQNKIIQIKLNGINYKPKFFFNDIELIDNQSPASGMFRSYSLDVTNLIDWNMKENNILVIIVYPPDIPGSSSSGSQGGDHKIAKNGGIMQCTAGWDWIQATPDRNTGIWDEVELTVSGYLEVTYPVIRTSIIHYHNFSAILEAEVLIVNHLKENILNAMVFISIYDKNNINIKKISQKINILSLSTQTIVLFNIELENVNLWWPHTHGDPYIYKATFEVYVENNDATSNILLIPSSSETIQFGIRTATGYLDESTEGWAFRINNVPIFIIGGNWIASDQLLRYSNGDEISLTRYLSELSLHRVAGINLIRVWGGGIAERSMFYSVCDKLGILVHQEFWMTGDNNGRWAGSYEWPDDHESYLLNAHHTILALRSHPSLLLWCAGNELSPKYKNPNPTISIGLNQLLATLDPGRFYIESSMSPQSPDVTLYDSSYALAPQDGPYGILYEDDWYNIRNSGLQNYSNTPISYQPEVGSVFTPVLRSLKLFLPSESLQPGSIPGYLATSDDVDPMWQYHKYISYVTDDYDHIYAYQSNYKQILTERKEVNRAKDSKLNGCMSAEDFAWTAQLVQYQQYRALVEGFMLHQWKFYSAVILWKSQSPWPALRGALYDYYLDTNGAFWGVRAATRSASLHAQLHPGTLGVSLINRSPKAVTDVRVTVHYTDLHGTRLHTTRLQAPRVAGNSVWNAPTRLQWPITKTNKSVLLFFLSIDETSTTSEDEKEEEIDENKNMSFSLSNFYWLTDPSLGLRKDYSELGWLRKQHTVHVTIEVMNVEYFSCTALLREGSPIALPRAACEPLEDASATCGGAREDEVLYAEFRVTTPRDASAVAFMVRHTLLRMPVTGSTYDDRVLPTFYSANYYVLPSGARVMIAIAARFSRHDTDGIYLETEGWNVPQSRIKLTSS